MVWSGSGSAAMRSCRPVLVAQAAGRQQRLAQVTAGLHQEMAAAGRRIDDLQRQQPGRVRIVRRTEGGDLRIQRLAHQEANEFMRRIERSRGLASHARRRKTAPGSISAGSTSGRHHRLCLAAPHADQRFGCDSRLLLQQSLVDAAEILHVQRAVMHPNPLAAWRNDPDQPVQQDGHRPVAPDEPVEQRCRAGTKQRTAQRRDMQFTAAQPIAKDREQRTQTGFQHPPVSCP